MQSEAMVHLRKEPPDSLARVAGVYEGGNIFVVERKWPDVKLPDQGEHWNIQRRPDPREVLVVQLANVLRRPQIKEVFVIGKQSLRDSRALGMSGGGLAHGDR